MSIYDRFQDCVRAIESLELEAQELVRGVLPMPAAVEILPHCLLIRYGGEPVGEDVLFPARQQISQQTGYPLDSVEISWLEPIPEGGTITSPEDRRRKKQTQN